MLSYFYMRDETKPWFEKAIENLDTAEYMFRGARYAPACFMCQQTIEVLLKGAIIELTNKRHPKVHDLVKLYVESGLTDFERFKDFLTEVDKHYYQVRYPDLVKMRYSKEVARETLTKTKEVFKWVKSRIEKS